MLIPTTQEQEININKVVKDGKVAVLISAGFGAGWYTWADDRNNIDMVFDPDLVHAVLDDNYERMLEVVKLKWPDEYTGGVDSLKVVWVPQGKQFRIDEYDGAESLVFNYEDTWLMA